MLIVWRRVQNSLAMNWRFRWTFEGKKRYVKHQDCTLQAIEEGNVHWSKRELLSNSIRPDLWSSPDANCSYPVIWNLENSLTAVMGLLGPQSDSSDGALRAEKFPIVEGRNYDQKQRLCVVAGGVSLVGSTVDKVGSWFAGKHERSSEAPAGGKFHMPLFSREEIQVADHMHIRKKRETLKVGQCTVRCLIILFALNELDFGMGSALCWYSVTEKWVMCHCLCGQWLKVQHFRLFMCICAEIAPFYV